MTLDYSLIQQSRSQSEYQWLVPCNKCESLVSLLLFPFYKSGSKGEQPTRTDCLKEPHVCLHERVCMCVCVCVCMCDDAKEGRRCKREERMCVRVCVYARARVVCVRACEEWYEEKDRKRDERTRGKQVRKKRENKREKEEKGSGGGRSSMNGGHWSHPPRTDRLSFSLPDSQVRLHNSQLLDRSLHIRDHRRPGRQRHHE